MTYAISLNGNKIVVANIACAQHTLGLYRDLKDLGSRDFLTTDGQLFKDGKQIGYVSYNGRVWDMDDKEIQL